MNTLEKAKLFVAYKGFNDSHDHCEALANCDSLWMNKDKGGGHVASYQIRSLAPYNAPRITLFSSCHKRIVDRQNAILAALRAPYVVQLAAPMWAVLNEDTGERRSVHTRLRMFGSVTFVQWADTEADSDWTLWPR